MVLPSFLELLGQLLLPNDALHPSQGLSHEQETVIRCMGEGRAWKEDEVQW